jgi:hypothetical protein
MHARRVISSVPAAAFRQCFLNSVSFTIARTWDGERVLERKLKKRKNGRKLCPICLKERHGKLA